MTRQHIIVADSAEPQDSQRQLHPLVIGLDGVRNVAVLVSPGPGAGKRSHLASRHAERTHRSISLLQTCSKEAGTQFLTTIGSRQQVQDAAIGPDRFINPLAQRPIRQECRRRRLINKHHVEDVGRRQQIGEIRVMNGDPAVKARRIQRFAGRGHA